MASELEKIKGAIASRRNELESAYCVKEIGIFGSYARGQQKKKSDVDVLVEFRKPVGLEFIDLRDYLERLLGKKVDLVTPRALKPRMRDQVMREVVAV